MLTAVNIAALVCNVVRVESVEVRACLNASSVACICVLIPASKHITELYHRRNNTQKRAAKRLCIDAIELDIDGAYRYLKKSFNIDRTRINPHYHSNALDVAIHYLVLFCLKSSVQVCHFWLVFGRHDGHSSWRIGWDD